MLGHDQQRIRLALALTMALPGTPFLMYGDEIGMGEDLSLPGRIAVRDPMQWSPGHAGGFSAACRLYRPTRADGPDGYRTVNVLDQRHDPDSLYSWVADLADLAGANQVRQVLGDPEPRTVPARRLRSGVTVSAGCASSTEGTAGTGIARTRVVLCQRLACCQSEGCKVPHTGSLRRCPFLIRGRQSA